MDHMGTGNDPTNSNYKADWDIAAAKWNTLGEIARDSGYVKLYTHNHDAAYSFLLDSGPLDAQGRPTRSSGIRKLEYFLGITDPKFVNLEMDIFWAHVAQYKHKTYTAPDGSIQTNIFNPLALVQAQRGPVPAVPRQGRQDQHRDRQRLRHGALRYGRHRLHDVLPGSDQPPPLPDV